MELIGPKLQSCGLPGTQFYTCTLEIVKVIELTEQQKDANITQFTPNHSEQLSFEGHISITDVILLLYTLWVIGLLLYIHVLTALSSFIL